jgi:hypothetical protein
VLLSKRILTRENAPLFRTSEPPVSVPKLQFARPAPLSTRPRLVGRKATARPVGEDKPPTAVAPRPCSIEPEPISEMLRPVSHEAVAAFATARTTPVVSVRRCSVTAPRTSPACRAELCATPPPPKRRGVGTTLVQPSASATSGGILTGPGWVSSHEGACSHRSGNQPPDSVHLRIQAAPGGPWSIPY